LTGIAEDVVELFWRILYRRNGVYRRFSKCDWDECYGENKAHANTQRRLSELLRSNVWGAIRVADRAVNRQCDNTKKLGLILSCHSSLANSVETTLCCRAVAVPSCSMATCRFSTLARCCLGQTFCNSDQLSLPYSSSSFIIIMLC